MKISILYMMGIEDLVQILSTLCLCYEISILKLDQFGAVKRNW